MGPCLATGRFAHSPAFPQKANVQNDQPLLFFPFGKKALVWLFSTCINMEDSRIGGDFYIKGTSLYVLFRDEVG
jgi:hypothetical protein